MATLFSWTKHLFSQERTATTPHNSDYEIAHDTTPLPISNHIIHGSIADERQLDRSRVEIHRYRTHGELYNQWRTLELSRSSSRLTAVFVLAAGLRCQLRTLIRRRPNAGHLIIVPATGRWPSVDSLVDLMMARTELGWDTIEVCRDLGTALERGFGAIEVDQRLVLFLPPYST
jgi:hypothetical protein